MMFRVKRSYKLFITSIAILSTVFVLFLFLHQLSKVALIISSIAYAGVLLLTAEAYFFFVELENLSIKSMYFKLKLDDIIEIDDSFFGTKIRTRWKVYYLPPMEKMSILKELVKNSRKEFNMFRTRRMGNGDEL